MKFKRLSGCLNKGGTYMKVSAAIKKTRAYFKKQGIDIEIDEPGEFGYKWTFTHNGRVGSFGANGVHATDPNVLDADACLFHVRGINDHSCSYTDYHAGSYRDNLTQVLHSLLPPPPKYPAGSLIRGKSNKRATRCGYAGKVGLVMQAQGGSYLKVAWNGEPKPSYGWPSIPERDIERVS